MSKISTMKIQLSGHHYHLIEIGPRHDLADKLGHLASSNNHSLADSIIRSSDNNNWTLFCNKLEFDVFAEFCNICVPI